MNQRVCFPVYEYIYIYGEGRGGKGRVWEFKTVLGATFPCGFERDEMGYGGFDSSSWRTWKRNNGKFPKTLPMFDWFTNTMICFLIG